VPRVRKCTFCADRLAKGRLNACAEACWKVSQETGTNDPATLAGDREALLAEARKRLQAEPGKYVPKIYGEHDAGGTSVLVLSPVPFEQLGLPENLPSQPLPDLTFRVLSKIPPLVGAGGLLLAGLWWLTNRKVEVAKAEGKGGRQ
jgi:formate dehydrogenase iron-sulfur subunit